MFIKVKVGIKGYRKRNGKEAYCSFLPPPLPVLVGNNRVYGWSGCCKLLLEIALLLLPPPLLQGPPSVRRRSNAFLTPSLMEGGWEEEQGLFNTVHSPHCPHSRMEGGWEEEHFKADQEHYSMYYDLLCRSSSIMDAFLQMTTIDFDHFSVKSVQY